MSGDGRFNGDVDLTEGPADVWMVGEGGGECMM